MDRSRSNLPCDMCQEPIQSQRVKVRIRRSRRCRSVKAGRAKRNSKGVLRERGARCFRRKTGLGTQKMFVQSARLNLTVETDQLEA